VSEWEHKDVWIQRRLTFAVEVSRHSVGEENKWAVYVYIYPPHSLFATIDHKAGMFQSTCNALPLHGGCSFFRRHLNPEKPTETTSYQIGADYDHYWDEGRFRDVATKDEAREVFDDAEELIRHMETYRG